MVEWQIESRFLEDDYVLIAPDGQRVGSFPTLEATKDELRRLQEESLEHTAPFDRPTNQSDRGE